MFEGLIENFKKIGKFAVDVAKNLGQAIKEDVLGVYKWGKEKITGEKIEGAKSPTEIIGSWTWQPFTRAISKFTLTGAEKLTGEEVEQISPAKTKFTEFLFGKEPIIPAEKELKLYQERFGKGIGTLAFAGFTAFDLYFPTGEGKVAKVAVSKQLLKDIAKTTDKEAIKNLLLKEIPELHHPSLIGRVDGMAEKLVQVDKPSLVRKTLRQEFDNIAKELGVDLAKIRGEVKEVKPEVKPIPKELEPLTEEARKSKDAEEFVNNLEKQGKIVYHGTTKEFDKFDLSFVGERGFTEGRGFYFTDNKKLAENYAREWGKPEITGRIIKAYLNIKKPMTLTQRKITDSQLKKILKEVVKERPEILDDYGVNSIDELTKILKENDSDIDIITELGNVGGIDKQKLNDIFTKITGYDGVVVKQKDGTKIYVAFNPNQIITEKELIDFYNQIAKVTKEPEPKPKKKPEEKLEEPPIPPRPPRNPPLDNIPFKPDFNEEGMKNYRIRGTFRNFWENKPEFKKRTEKLLNELSVYYPQMSNKEMVERAVAELNSLDINEAYRQWAWRWQKNYPRDPGRLAMERVKATIMSEVFWDLKQYKKAIDLANWVFESGTELGRAVEVGKVLPKLSSAYYRVWAPNQFEKVLREMAITKGIKITDEFINDVKGKLAHIYETRVNPKDLEKELEKFIEKEVAPQLKLTPRERFDLFRYANMLSGPLTQLRNIWGNFTQLILKNLFVLPTQAVIEYMKHPSNPALREVAFSDIPVVWKKTLTAFWPAAQTFWKVLTWQETPISSKWMDIMKDKDSFESLINYYRYKNAPLIDKAYQLPLRTLEAADRFFSTLVAAGEEARLKNMYERMGKKITPVLEKEIQERAQEAGENYLFRRELGFKREDLSYVSQALDALGETILNIRNHYLNHSNRAVKIGLGYPLSLMVPFFRTPINIGIAMLEFSPLGFLRGNYTSEKLAQSIVGSVALLVGAMKAFSGETTWAAPSDPKERAIFYETRKPFSINIHGIDVPYLYFGSLGLAMAIPAAVKWVITERQPKWSPGLDEAITMSILQGLRFISSQTSLQGLTNWGAILSGEQDWNAAGALGYTLGQFIPLEGFLKWVSKIVDPVYRKMGVDFMGSIKDTIPFLRKTMEAYENVGGEAEYHWYNLALPYGGGKFNLPLQVALREMQIDKRRRKAWAFYEQGKLKLQDIEKWVNRVHDIPEKPLSRDDIQKGMEIIENLGKYNFENTEAENSALYFATVFLEQLAKENKTEEFKEAADKIPEKYREKILKIREERKLEKQLPAYIPDDIKDWKVKDRAKLLYKYFKDLTKRGISQEKFDKIQYVLRERGVLTDDVADEIRSLLMKEKSGIFAK